MLDDQKHLYQELKKKLKSIDVEDDRRREKNLTEMDNYYKNKLNEIETELVFMMQLDYPSGVNLLVPDKSTNSNLNISPR